MVPTVSQEMRLVSWPGPTGLLRITGRGAVQSSAADLASLPAVRQACGTVPAVPEAAAGGDGPGAPPPAELYGFPQFDTVDDFSDHKFAQGGQPAQNPR